MDLKTRIDLMLAPLFSKMHKNDVKTIKTILTTLDSGAYAVPGYTLVISKRMNLEQQLRGVFRNADSPRGFVIGPASLEMMDHRHERAIEILKFLIRWNEHQKEKHASRYAKARRNGDPRPRRGTDRSNSSPDQGTANQNRN